MKSMKNSRTIICVLICCHVLRVRHERHVLPRPLAVSHTRGLQLVESNAPAQLSRANLRSAGRNPGIFQIASESEPLVT